MDTGGLTMNTSAPAAEPAESEVGSLATSPLFNPELAPVPIAERRWRACSSAGLRISMAACIPAQVLASSPIEGGMNWWQAALTISLGNVLVQVPMLLNAQAGTKYGISFPIDCRANFGTSAANVTELTSAFVACDCFRRQTRIGGNPSNQ